MFTSDVTHLFFPALGGLNGWRLFCSQVSSEHQPHTKPRQALAREANTPSLHRASRGDRRRTRNWGAGEVAGPPWRLARLCPLALGGGPSTPPRHGRAPPSPLRALGVRPASPRPVTRFAHKPSQGGGGGGGARGCHRPFWNAPPKGLPFQSSPKAAMGAQHTPAESRQGRVREREVL